MNVQGLIERLQNYVAHGGNLGTNVMVWDPDEEDWRELGLMYSNNYELKLYPEEDQNGQAKT